MCGSGILNADQYTPSSCKAHNTGLAFSPGIKWNCGALFGRLEYAGEHYGRPENYCRNIYDTPHVDNCLSAKSLALFSISISSFQTTSCRFYCALRVSHIFLTAPRDAPGGLCAGSALNSGVVDLAFNYGRATWCHFYCAALFSLYKKWTLRATPGNENLWNGFNCDFACWLFEHISIWIFTLSVTWQ